MQERLQKIIARAGISSRRGVEEMILQGRVRVNGSVIFKLGTKANVASDHIKVDGKLLKSTTRAPVYIMLHKPKGYMTTRHDPEGRPIVMDLLKRLRSKVYPVGRLDYNSEGLLLFTNDGEFAEKVLSAESKITKTYQVKINGNPSDDDLQKLREGVKLGGQLTAPARVRLFRVGPNPWYEVTLTQGRKNQVRRMFKKCGLLVEKLKRVKVGSLALGRLASGKYRYLKPEEVMKILQSRKISREITREQDGVRLGWARAKRRQGRS